MQDITPTELGKMLRGKPSERKRARKLIEERTAGASTEAERARAVGVSAPLWYQWRKQGLLPAVQLRASRGDKIELWQGQQWIRGIVKSTRVELRVSTPQKYFTIPRNQLPNFIAAMQGVGWS